MPETSLNSDQAERLRPVLVADISQKLFEARNKSEHHYQKAIEAEIDCLCQTARKLAHPDPLAFADSVINESLHQPDLHPQLISEIVDRILVTEKLKTRDQTNINHAIESIGHGESDAEITADLIQRTYPEDPATGYDYAQYILAKTRLAIARRIG